MNKKTLKYSFFISVIILFISSQSYGQSYKKDSLQIKAYTEIEYVDGRMKSLKLKKVFCDYCSERQLKLLGEDALRRTENEKNDPKNKLKNGKKKVAVYIRIAKTDFASIRGDK